MPWIYNPGRDAYSIKMQDGVSFGFPPRKKVYVKPDNMSAEAWRRIQSGQLVNKGGDPAPKPPIQISAPIPPPPVTPTKSVTSSNHHQADARVSVIASIVDLGEKEVKPEKKQTDETEKATSETSEVVTKSDDKKSERRSRRSRRGQ